jgi:hypothetical protein
MQGVSSNMRRDDHRIGTLPVPAGAVADSRELRSLYSRCELPVLGKVAAVHRYVMLSRTFEPLLAFRECFEYVHVFLQQPDVTRFSHSP